MTEFWPIAPLPHKVWPVPPTHVERLTNPAHFLINFTAGILINHAHSSVNSDLSSQLLQKVWPFFQLSKEFRPVLPTPEGIVTDPAESLINSCPPPDEFWPIPTAQAESLTYSNYSCRKFDRSYPHPKEFCPLPPNVLPIPPTPERILTNPDCSHRNLNQFHPLLKEICPVPSAIAESLTNPAYSHSIS